MVVMRAIMPHTVEPVLALGDVDRLCGVVLAAGEGTRLRPLTRVRPKPLCPVGNVPLVDLAIERVRSVTPAVAVNVHHDREVIEAHVGAASLPVHLSVEEDQALGTAGALGHLRPWIDGRTVVVVNGDTWCPGSLGPLVDGWDGDRVRLLLSGPADRLRRTSRIAAALMPWWSVAPLAAEPTGLYEVSWGGLAEAGRVETVPWEGPCLDCGTPARYLTANLTASGGRTVAEPGARVLGRAERSVLWNGAVVEEGEVLRDAIRTEHLTVLVR
jgi:N-acetyl-alpha-D-muramate 1-phosphate uridylyltransferase